MVVVGLFYGTGTKEGLKDYHSHKKRKVYIIVHWYTQYTWCKMDNSKEIPTGKRNIKLDLRTWNTLKNLKKPNETFNDVILFLLKERTVSAEKGNLQAIKYTRMTMFMETDHRFGSSYKSVGVEFEYNDIKGQQTDFTLDLKFRKVFFGKRIMNPSEFFGVDNQHKHLHPVYLGIYLKCVLMALKKELKILAYSSNSDFENIALWRKIYYDHSLSEESFSSDVEEPLRLSVEEKMSHKIRETIKNSPSNSLWKIIP